MNTKKQVPNFITLINLALGFLSILFAVNNQFFASAFLILGAVIFDYLDGRLARKLEAESDLGAELDSLADLVSFGVAPAVLMYSVLANTYLVLVLVLFVLAGAFRLAKFNILRKQITDFTGMPITVNGLIFPILYFARATVEITIIVFVIAIILMLSTFKFKKVI